jgi:hypothetical protein
MLQGQRLTLRRALKGDLVVVHLGGTTLPGDRVVTMDGEWRVRFLRAVEPRRDAADGLLRLRALGPS